jgi:hypothetical protein
MRTRMYGGVGRGPLQCGPFLDCDGSSLLQLELLLPQSV